MEENKKEHNFLKKVATVLGKKWLVNGYITIILIAVIVAFYMGVNILLEKVTLPEIDLTSEKMFSISQETKDKVGGIDKEITITLINYSNSTAFVNFIERYKIINKNIKIEKIDDLSARSEIMTKYSLEATDSLIIIESGENEKTLSSSDFYTYDYTTGEQIDVTEEAITNAILDISTQDKPKIYFSNTHLQFDLQYYSIIMEEIEGEANQIEQVDILSSGSVPEDCDVLVLTTLKEDLTELERDKIIEYIKNGGEILLMCGPNIKDISLTNFQKVLDEYGLTIENGVIFEGNASNMMSGYPDIIVEQTQPTKLTEKLNMATKLGLVDAGKLTFNEEKLEELGIEYEVLATTTEKAFLRTDLNLQSISKTEQDQDAANSIVAAVVTKTIDENKTSKLIVYTNEIFATDMPIQNGQYTMYIVDLYNNRDLILNSISYLSERENTITIRKTSDDVAYTVTEAQNNIILAIIFVTPLVIIVLGIVIWQIRRRKK